MIGLYLIYNRYSAELNGTDENHESDKLNGLFIANMIKSPI